MRRDHLTRGEHLMIRRAASSPVFAVKGDKVWQFISRASGATVLSWHMKTGRLSTPRDNHVGAAADPLAALVVAIETEERRALRQAEMGPWWEKTRRA